MGERCSIGPHAKMTPHVNAFERAAEVSGNEWRSQPASTCEERLDGDDRSVHAFKQTRQEDSRGFGEGEQGGSTAE